MAPTESNKMILILLATAVAIIVAAVHGPALSAKTLWIDDDQYLTDNLLVRNPSLSSAKQFFAEVLNPSTVGGYYHPISMTSLMLDYALGGRPDNLRPFHRTSLCLHVMNALLVVGLLYLLFGDPIAAAVGGLLFGLCPMTVEPIPWVGERKTLIATFFALGSLLLYAMYARRSNKALYGAFAAAYVLALLSKPTITPVPVIMLLLDYWPLARFSRRTVLEKVPLLVVGGIFGVITIISHGQTSPIEVSRDNPVSESVYILCHNVVLYLSSVAWPGDYTSPYFFPEPLGPSNPHVLAGLIGTAILIAIVAVSLRWTPALLVGLLAFFVALAPAISVIKTNPVIASDKYAYFPLVGLTLPVAWLWTRLWKTTAGGPRPTVRRVALVAILVILAVGEARATRRYLAPWQEKERLLRHLLSKWPKAAAYHYGLGNLLANRGDLDGAVKSLETSLELSPTLLDARERLAGLLLRRGKTQEARGHLEEVIRQNPTAAQAHYLLANALLTEGRADEAAAHYALAVRLKPDLAEAHNNWGAILLRQGKIDEAIHHFTEALRLKPDLENARKNLNTALARRNSRP